MIKKILFKLIFPFIEIFLFLKYLFFVRKLVIIFQPGKVGSKSIYHSIKKINKNVIHVHEFNNFYEYKNHKSFYKINASYDYLHFGGNAKIITCIRNPLERNISMFFNQLASHESFYGLKDKDWQSNISIDDLKNIFIEKFDHENFLYWYDFNIFRNFKIDIYSKKISEYGYVIYNHNDFDIDKVKLNHQDSLLNVQNKNELILIKTELDNSIKNKVLSKFLDINISIEKMNQTIENKDIGLIYNKFRDNVKFDSNFLNKYLNSNFFRHFYIDDTQKIIKKYEKK